jgi:hypothetical protein
MIVKLLPKFPFFNLLVEVVSRDLFVCMLNLTNITAGITSKVYFYWDF